MNLQVFNLNTCIFILNNNPRQPSYQLKSEKEKIKIKKKQSFLVIRKIKIK